MNELMQVVPRFFLQSTKLIKKLKSKLGVNS